MENYMNDNKTLYNINRIMYSRLFFKIILFLKQKGLKITLKILYTYRTFFKTDIIKDHL